MFALKVDDKIMSGEKVSTKNGASNICKIKLVCIHMCGCDLQSDVACAPGLDGGSVCSREGNGR